MTSVLDQFSVASTQELSGTYLSRYVIGRPSLISSSINSSRTIYNTNRIAIADKTTGPYSDTNSVVPVWRYTDWWNHFSGSFLRSNNRFVTPTNDNLFFYDSYVPNMYRICLTNNEDISINNSVTFRTNEDLNIRGFSASQSISFIIKSGSQWFKSYPFESKYKTIGRQLAQGNRLGFVTGSASFFAYFQIQDPSADLLLISEITCSSDPVTTFNSILLGQQFENQNGGVSKSLPTFEEYRKLFYGIGDGLLPRTDGYTSTEGFWRQFPAFSVRYFPDPFLLGLPVFRGFKYGLLNSDPISPKHYFRRTRFGQFRDMLESSPVACYFEPPRTITYPVTVGFLSGTSIYNSASLYANATTTSSFNLRDSGIYDYHARSGMPFFDIENLD